MKRRGVPGVAFLEQCCVPCVCARFERGAPVIATISSSSVDTETILYQAVVDHEFRTRFMDTPESFGIDRDTVVLPDAVERQEQESLKIWSEGLAALDVYDCVSTCSWGPITAVCDGTTK